MKNRQRFVRIIALGLAALMLFSLERVSGVAVDFEFLLLVESRIVAQDAEVVDFVVRAGGLVAELVAGEVEDFETFVVVFFI